MDTSNMERKPRNKDISQKLKLLFEALDQDKTTFQYIPKQFENLSNFETFLLKEELAQTYDQCFLSDYLKKKIVERGVIYSWLPNQTTEIINAALKLTCETYAVHEKIVARDLQERQRWESFKIKQKAVSANEIEWQDRLLKYSETHLPGFQYLYEFDWHPVENMPQFGRNDLILSNGSGVFAVVEVKVVQNTIRPGKKLNKVIDQARKYKSLYLEANEKNFDVISVIGVTFTDQDGGKIGFVGKNDEEIASVATKQLSAFLNKKELSPTTSLLGVSTANSSDTWQSNSTLKELTLNSQSAFAHKGKGKVVMDDSEASQYASKENHPLSSKIPRYHQAIERLELQLELDGGSDESSEHSERESRNIGRFLQMFELQKQIIEVHQQMKIQDKEKLDEEEQKNRVLHEQLFELEDKLTQENLQIQRQKFLLRKESHRRVQLQARIEQILQDLQNDEADLQDMLRESGEGEEGDERDGSDSHRSYNDNSGWWDI